MDEEIDIEEEIEALEQKCLDTRYCRSRSLEAVRDAISRLKEWEMAMVEDEEREMNNTE